MSAVTQQHSPDVQPCVRQWVSEVVSHAHLRVRVQNFDPLSGDEQIDLSEGLSVSVCTLRQDKTRQKQKQNRRVGKIVSFDLEDFCTKLGRSRLTVIHNCLNGVCIRCRKSINSEVHNACMHSLGSSWGNAC